MKKFALFALIAVLSFGFVGCSTGDYVAPWTPPALFVATIEYAGYGAVNTEHNDMTIVVFSYASQRSRPIYLSGDQRNNFLVGEGYMLYTSAFGQDMRTGARSTICSFDYGGRNYVVSFYSE
ncbi:MAG: hypothetical protein AAB345_03130 [Patescibacteria group bacterium]